MFKFMGNKRLIVLLLGLICFFILMGFTLVNRFQVTWPEKVFKDSVSWVQGIFYKPAGAVAGFFDDLGELKTIYKENQVLKQQVVKYAEDTQRLNFLEQKTKRLEELLEFTEEQKKVNNYKYHAAEVIASSNEAYNNTVTVNLGEKDGIKTDMAVMTVDGLIGRVIRVSGFTSTVQLLTNVSDTDMNSKAIAVTTKKSPDSDKPESYGIIENYENNMLVMNRVEKDDPIQEGDEVITSGLGQVYPAGIRVGKVVSRKPGDLGVNDKVLVEPYANFSHIREVLIVEVPEVK
ncbi:rod shape-determining protein MreC [Paenibacillus larvae]|uniref:Cell shape-determining protein MreC n=5 Tax=Paenibacillus larvae TaxID=1464 RepID=V9WA65_9BACL|nr:rod shape-determining protein MreC [Paenibacillus larvae]AHD06610.1 Rod shape-determining protein MreC [Paenibacillus larvae subsp. larvae DSM 25430]AVF21327.1 Rod shape-determining protein MreC [Paenibacillus larvae subsp. larvae]AVF27511.1 Rod shape-determining protein MreC [Paenibacillus larvae subsp. larvae]AVF32174.1 Rod shape-determining protein MreC [Paenibacillus larvae subsp. larvae]AVG13169.1 Rod shape-determining protein MreC [Paenibacillus larvae subsp. larvae DSM 25430]